MRVLIITHYWSPHVGGVETVAWEQARRLTERGHRVTVVTSRLDGDPAVSESDGLTVHRVAALNALEGVGIPYPLFSLRLLSLVSGLVQEQDVVLVHSHTFLGSVAGALMARRHRRPLVVLQHNPFVRYRLPWRLVERAADLTLGRYTLRSATEVLAVSRYTRAYVQSLAPREVEVLHNGVDTGRFSAASSFSDVERAREALGLPGDAFVLFTLRRLVFRNGIDTLLAACVELKAQPAIQVVIGGEGPERRSIERHVTMAGLDNVRLVGNVQAERLPDYYRAADAFVLPTRTGEGFGLVLLEAFASGIPAVATTGGAPEELVRDGRNGLLVPPADPAALAAAVVYLYQNRDRAREMGVAARADAEGMSWERCIDRLEAALERAAVGGAPPETVAAS